MTGVHYTQPVILLNNIARQYVLLNKKFRVLGTYDPLASTLLCITFLDSKVPREHFPFVTG